jgi:hypothetical protein
LDLLFNPGDFSFFDSALKNSVYLEGITEDTLWERYEFGIDLVAQRPFEDFNKAHRDALFRLKMCSVDKRLRMQGQETQK